LAHVGIAKVYPFHMVLSYSRDPICCFTTSQDLAAFWDCHRRAFAHSGGVPKSIVYDRTKTVVRRHGILKAGLPGADRRLHGVLATDDGRPLPRRRSTRQRPDESNLHRRRAGVPTIGANLWGFRMRVLLLMLAAVVAVGMVAVGGVGALVGYLDQREADQTYTVEFTSVGADCGGAWQVHLDLADGKPLACRPGYTGVVGSSPRDDFPGFSDEQNERVLALAASLGSDGISAADQGEIQALVDQTAAGVPDGQRPDRRPGLWGARQAWLGGGLAVSGALGLIAMLFFSLISDRRYDAAGPDPSPVVPG
jgi:hypothetical protein